MLTKHNVNSNLRICIYDKLMCEHASLALLSVKFKHFFNLLDYLKERDYTENNFHIEN